MASFELRVGNVSEIFPDIGMIAVTYPQFDDATTGKIPLLAFTDEYKVPAVGDRVAVVHFGNGPAFAIVLAHYWNEKNLCPEPGAKVWWKTFSPFVKWPTKAYAKYDDDECTLRIFLPHKVDIVLGPCPEHLDESGELTVTVLGKEPTISIKAQGDKTSSIDITADASETAAIAVGVQSDATAAFALSTEGGKSSAIDITADAGETSAMNVDVQGGETSTMNVDVQGGDAGVINVAALGDENKINLTADLTTNSGDYETPADVTAGGVSLKGHAH